MAQPLKPSEIASLVAAGIGESALVLEVFVARDAFAKMFADFGGELPALTRLMLGTPLPYVLLALPSLLLVLGFVTGRRGPLLAASAAVSLASAALFLVAMYLPIFELAGSVQA